MHKPLIYVVSVEPSNSKATTCTGFSHTDSSLDHVALSHYSSNHAQPLHAMDAAGKIGNKVLCSNGSS